MMVDTCIRVIIVAYAIAMYCSLLKFTCTCTCMYVISYMYYTCA